MQLCVLNVSRPQACDFPGVIPEIDIWRAATLMLKRYGEKALEQRAPRAPSSSLLTGITTVLQPGAGSPPPSSSSRTTPGPDHSTDRNGPETTLPLALRFIIDNRFDRE
jgi:hypothetical protein